MTLPVQIARRCALAAIVAAPFVLPALAAAQDPDRGDDPARAMEWFYHQRAYPAATIPAGARQAALRQFESRWPQAGFSRSLAPAGAAYSTASTWTGLGPAPIGYLNGPATSGRINAIALQPKSSSVIYIGAATGGVWKTTDGGSTWTPLTDGTCGLAMGSIAIDQVNPQIVYAGTGEDNFSGDSYQGCGLLRSTDGGSTWTPLGADVFTRSDGYAAHVARVLVDPATAGSTTSSVVFVACSFGLFRSATSGDTWTPVLGANVTDLVENPATPSTLYAGTAGGAIYQSVDTGNTWVALGGGLPTSGMGRTSLAVAPSKPSVLYASFANASSGSVSFYKTTDGGSTWTALAASGASCSSQCWYDMAITVSPVNDSIVYFSGFSLYRSGNAGASFANIGSAIHVDHHVLAVDPQTPTTIYAGSDGGIFKSTDEGATWTTLNTTLAITQFYPGLSVSQTSATTMIGGTQDNGTAEWGGAALWPQVTGGDGGYTLYDPVSGATFVTYASGSYILGAYRRDKGSTYFYQRNSGINTSDRSEWILPLVMDPSDHKVLYYGTYKLYRSANSADSWAAISGDLTFGGGGISTVAVAPSDSSTIYVGAGDGKVSVTTDLGATWTDITAGLPSRYITRITVDAIDSRTAWLTVSGFGSGHVFKTVNGGASWTDISYDLPNIPVNAVVRQRGSEEIDVGTDIGIFALQDGASSWMPLAAGMPNTVVMDLVYDGPRGRLMAATHGRGAFSLPVTYAVLRGNISTSGTLSALDAQEILSSVVALPLPAGAKRFPYGDANCDGDVTASDALLVLSKLVGLPTGTACVGTVK